MCTINRTGGRLFGPNGCQVPIGKGICGETRTLDIINEFKRLYEEKMKEIDNNGGGDCLQEKIKLQQDWIGDLTDQNEMLVRAVEELELEATERVNMLEEKLQESAKCICEVMKRYREYDMTNELLKEPQEKIFHLENDLKNLLEFLRRIRVKNEWSMDGLTFYQITHQDLFSEKVGKHLWREKCDRYLACDNAQEEKKLKDRECTIQELHLKLVDVNVLSQELNNKKQECDTLQKNIIDMRQALTEEVASKHDTILKLKRDCQELEDRCIQADKQTAFRDDIIKELRKEIKQLKQQISLPPEIPSKSNPTEFTRKSSNGEHVLVINHTKKIVQSGRSTVIYLQHGSDKKAEDKEFKTVFEDHTSNCSKCRNKLKNVKGGEIQAKNSNVEFEDENRLHLCKSENDLIDFKKLLRPVKERSKFTNASFSRCNTFVGSTADALKNVDFESRLKRRNVSLPSNMPVKCYVNHLEINKEDK